MQDFINYLDQKIASGKADIAALTEEGRKDDADFAKIRTNIYDVCKTVTQALINRPGAGADAVKVQFGRFESAWGAALEKAREHGNIGAVAVEETKLAALEDIAAHFSEVTKE